MFMEEITIKNKAMKKEIIKPFDLEAYENGAKVKTRNGHEVRITCTNVKALCFPIIALVEIDDSTEVVMRYTSKGEIDAGDISDNDLVIVEEVEEPEFWSDNRDNKFSGFYVNGSAGISKISQASNIEFNYNVYATKKQAKSAIAMAKLSQIMANDIKNFGGAITDEEWKDLTVEKYVICRLNNAISLMCSYLDYRFLAFHTEAQRDLFLEKYRDLVKDYLCLD
jgi:hypothetical protein